MVDLELFSCMSTRNIHYVMVKYISSSMIPINTALGQCWYSLWYFVAAKNKDPTSQLISTSTTSGTRDNLSNPIVI